MRPPFTRVPRGGLLHHLIDLFKSEALGFIDEEVSVEEGDRTQRTPEEEDFWAEVGLVRVD